MRMRLSGWPNLVSVRPAGPFPALAALLLVAALTTVLFLLNPLVGFKHISIVYLIPVMISATRWGTIPAVIAAVAGFACADFFFYPPLYTFWVEDPQQLLDLVLFLIVAVVTGYLASVMRQHAEIARRHESDMRDLHAFSRRLAQCDSAADIHAAIEDHLSRTVGRRAVLIGVAPRQRAADSSGAAAIPDLDRREAGAIAARPEPRRGSITGAAAESLWLVRPVSAKSPELGMIAIDLGGEPRGDDDEITRTVDAVLADAAETLERLDVATAIHEARLRAETDTLREALIGSVSHELRTPLASILGAASVIAATPAVAQDPRLTSLAELVRDEAEHLNGDIQDLLDATRISAQGVQPKREWADPTDIVHVAVERRRRRLANHRVEMTLSADLPLLHVDPVLLEQALGQILGNAAKYSPPGSTIWVRAYRGVDHVVLSVQDQGAGLTADERTRVGERTFRGRRHVLTIAGSGLGMWIAQAFVSANGGRIDTSSEGEGRGTIVAFSFPISWSEEPQISGVDDDEPQIRRFLRAGLELEDFIVREAGNAGEGIRLATLKTPDLVILDLGLPDMDGADVVECLRAWSNVPIIVLSVRAEEDEKVRLLELGADDYVVKPFGMAELLARARAALRRNVRAPSGEPVVTVGPLAVDFAARIVSLDGQRLPLTPKEYRLLQVLTLNAGKVVTHQHLLKEVWGSSHVHNTQYLRILIRKLRQKIEPDPTQPRILATELGVGYRLEAEPRLPAA